MTLTEEQQRLFDELTAWLGEDYEPTSEDDLPALEAEVYRYVQRPLQAPPPLTRQEALLIPGEDCARGEGRSPRAPVPAVQIDHLERQHRRVNFVSDVLLDYSLDTQ